MKIVHLLAIIVCSCGTSQTIQKSSDDKIPYEQTEAFRKSVMVPSGPMPVTLMTVDEAKIGWESAVGTLETLSQYVWVHHSPGQPLPSERYQPGYDNGPSKGKLGVCRTNYNGGIHPGKIFDVHCNIGWGTKEVVLDDFDVLIASTAPNAFWYMEPRNLDLPQALPGGVENGNILYVCIADYWTGGFPPFLQWHGQHPGKYIGGRCNFGWGGREIEGDRFWLLGFGHAHFSPSPPPPNNGGCKVPGEIPCLCPRGGFNGCAKPGYCNC